MKPWSICECEEELHHDLNLVKPPSLLANRQLPAPVSSESDKRKSFCGSSEDNGDGQSSRNAKIYSSNELARLFSLAPEGKCGEVNRQDFDTLFET